MPTFPPPETFDSPLISPDKRRTSYFDCVVVDGIEIESRYQQAHEFDLMAAWMRRLPERVRAKIVHVWCDSKATYVFAVRLRAGLVGAWSADDRLRLDSEMRDLMGGHNGVFVRSASGRLVDNIDAGWEIDEWR